MNRPRRTVAAALAALAAAGAFPFGARAADAPAAKGALERMAATGTVRIGFRDNAVPFSFASTGGQPQGYSIDLCLGIVEDLSAAIGGKPLKAEYRRVTPTDRIDQVAQGRVDLECGATSVTEERRKRVAFSPVTFIAGTRLLVKKGSGLHGPRDLPGKTVVVVSGTTNARAMVEMAAGKVRDLRVTTAPDYAAALAMVDRGAADALAADDVLLAGFLAERRLQDRYLIIGHPMTLDPYAVAFAKDDPAMADAVRVAFARMASTGELRSAYDRWFVKRLPSGYALDWPMGAELKRAFEVMGMPAE